MVYIRADGSVAEQKTWYRSIVDFFKDLYNVIALFWLALVQPGQVKKLKATSSSSSSRANQDKRISSKINPPGVKGSNIRGVKSLGLQGQGGCGGGGG